MDSSIQSALARLHRARSVDEGDECAEELARAARQNIGEVIALYPAAGRDAGALVTSLHGLTERRVIEFFTEALKHRDKYVRWAAIEGLKYAPDPALAPLFIGALKDRADLVRLVAVEWLKLHGTPSAIGPLEHLSRLPSLIKYSPGTVALAAEALNALRGRK